MVKSVLIRQRGIGLPNRRLDVLHRNSLLGSRLVHRDGAGNVLLESRLLRKRVCLWLRQVVERRLDRRNDVLDSTRLRGGVHNRRNWRLSQGRQANDWFRGVKR